MHNNFFLFNSRLFRNSECDDKKKECELLNQPHVAHFCWLNAQCSLFYCRRCCFCFFLFRRSFALSRVCHCHCHTLAHNTHISTIILFHPFSLHKRLQHFASLFHVHFFLLLFLPFALWFKYSFTFANHFYKYRLFAQLCLVFICSIILRFVVVCLLVCSFERFFC